ncbi:MAG TPA: DUF6340 family protein [Puia sp.]|nr:DUF6340 family protein [Puia sp.]
MKKTVFLAFLPFVICSCSSTELIFLSVKKPAPVTVPSYIKSVAVVDRSMPSRDSKTLDAVQRTLSLETVSMNREGAHAGVSGLVDELIRDNRFSVVKPLDSLQLTSFGAGVFPAAMSWDDVEKICRQNNCDALFSLEMFDADAKLNIPINPVSLSSAIASLPTVAQQVTMQTVVKTGWRIYDPSGRNILDEYVMSGSLNSTGSGITPSAAAASLIGRKEAVKQVANKAGQDYATRIIPYWIRVSRDYFVRGSDNFRVARRKAQTGNWDDAAKLWQQETGNPHGKIAGRACYNLAIIYEINGDLDGAIQWAQKAYENYGTPFALRYVNILKNRKVNNAVIEDQQAN